MLTIDRFLFWWLRWYIGTSSSYHHQIDGLMQKRRNSSVFSNSVTPLLRSKAEVWTISHRSQWYTLYHLHHHYRNVIAGFKVIWTVNLWKAQNPLQWRHNGRDSVLNHQPYHCLLNRLFERRSKKISKLHVTVLCEGNSPGTSQRASNAENASIWWRHHAFRSEIDVNFLCKLMAIGIGACDLFERYKSQLQKKKTM